MKYSTWSLKTSRNTANLRVENTETWSKAAVQKTYDRITFSSLHADDHITTRAAHPFLQPSSCTFQRWRSDSAVLTEPGGSGGTCRFVRSSSALGWVSACCFGWRCRQTDARTSSSAPRHPLQRRRYQTRTGWRRQDGNPAPDKPPWLHHLRRETEREPAERGTEEMK